jgi:hypothetical protein
MNNKTTDEIVKTTPFGTGWMEISNFCAILELQVSQGRPFVQLLDGSDAGIDDGEKLSEDDLELWLVKICLKCGTEFFGVLLDEKGKLAELFSAVFERESYSIIVSSSKARVGDVHA